MADDFPMKNTGPQLIGYVDNATDFTRLVTDAQPLPVTVASGGPSGYTLEATQLLVLAAVDGVEALLTTLDGRVDGIEALIGTTNTTLTTIDGRVDTLEALLAPLVLAGQGTKSVAAAATPEAISGSSVPCKLVMLTNVSANPIAYGTSTAVSVTGFVGAQIAAGKSHAVPVSNLNLLFVDVTTDGDDVGYTYYT